MGCTPRRSPFFGSRNASSPDLPSDGHDNDDGDYHKGGRDPYIVGSAGRRSTRGDEFGELSSSIERFVFDGHGPDFGPRGFEP